MLSHEPSHIAQFQRGQIWHWHDPIFGYKNNSNHSPPGLEKPMRFSRNVLILQVFNYPDGSVASILACPISTSNHKAFDYPVYVFRDSTVTAYIRCQSVFPVHPKSLTKYHGALTREQMRIVTENIVNIVSADDPVNEIGWEGEEITTTGGSDNCSDVDPPPINPTPVVVVVPEPPVIKSTEPECHQFDLNKLSHLMTDVLRANDLYLKVSGDWKSKRGKPTPKDFYECVARSIYQGFSKYLNGQPLDPNQRISPLVFISPPGDQPDRLGTWKFISTRESDPYLEVESHGRAFHRKCRDKYGEGFGPAVSWLEFFEAALYTRLRLMKPGIKTIVKMVEDLWCAK